MKKIRKKGNMEAQTLTWKVKYFFDEKKLKLTT
jgi:hypothetical protein